MQVSVNLIARGLRKTMNLRFLFRICLSAFLASVLMAPPVSSREGFRQVAGILPFYCGDDAAVTVENQPMYQGLGFNGSDLVLTAAAFGDSAGYVWGPFIQKRTILGRFQQIELNYKGIALGVDVTFCFFGGKKGDLSFTIPLSEFKRVGTSNPMQHATLTREQIKQLEGEDLKDVTIQRVAVNLQQFNRSQPSQSVVFGDVKIRIGDKWYEPVGIDTSTSSRLNCRLRGCN
jgi:hypothetical protein